jgi:hypothetical protein
MTSSFVEVADPKREAGGIGPAIAALDIAMPAPSTAAPIDDLMTTYPRLLVQGFAQRSEANKRSAPIQLAPRFLPQKLGANATV